MILETPRLSLRQLNKHDLPALRAILQDPETMTAYEGAFDDSMVNAWLDRMLERYTTDGFGLWAVTLSDTGGAEPEHMIGQCGLTRQNVLGADVVEVGYLFNRAYWRQGYAVAAQTCRISRLLSTGRPPRPLQSDLFHLL